MMIYQHTRIAGNQALYISGQTPMKANQTPKDIETQLDNVLEKIGFLLEENRLTVNELVKLTIYITDVSYLGAVRAKLAKFIGEPKPTATLVVVAGLIDPDFKVEIDGIASL